MAENQGDPETVEQPTEAPATTETPETVTTETPSTTEAE